MGDPGSRGVPVAGSGDGGAPPVRRRNVLGEVFVLWLLTLLLIRGVKELVGATGLPDLVLVLVPILFMYAPVVLCRIRGVDPWIYPMHLPSFRDREPWVTALKLNVVVIGVIIVPWLASYHLWQTSLFPWLLETLGLGRAPDWHYRGTWPENMWMLVGYHLFFVAIPEEFFYRGYIQTRLDEVYAKRWNVFGVRLGWGWLLTCAIFAFGHSIVSPQWWHFAIIIPSLVFGWMREKTGGVLAGALFHAWANVQVTTLDTLYGVIPVKGP